MIFKKAIGFKLNLASELVQSVTAVWFFEKTPANSSQAGFIVCWSYFKQKFVVEGLLSVGGDGKSAVLELTDPIRSLTFLDVLLGLPPGKFAKQTLSISRCTVEWSRPTLMSCTVLVESKHTRRIRLARPRAPRPRPEPAEEPAPPPLPPPAAAAGPDTDDTDRDDEGGDVEPEGEQSIEEMLAELMEEEGVVGEDGGRGRYT
jgi:hypothetical protein